MKIRCCLLAVWLLGSSVIANAGNGIKRSEWSLRTELSAGDIVIGDIGVFGLSAHWLAKIYLDGFQQKKPTLVVPYYVFAKHILDNNKNFGS